jgi:hypothetical protein
MAAFYGLTRVSDILAVKSQNIKKYHETIKKNKKKNVKIGALLAKVVLLY